jgi:aminoglycoside phosphotransferase (APT) family kinase protein
VPQLDPIAENLSLLIAEMDGQLQKLVTYFKDPQSELAAQLMQRAGYSGNLSSRVSKVCLAAMIREKQNNRTDLHLQGIDTIARNLDLIARLGRRAVDQAEKVERKRVLRAMEYVAPLGRVRKTLGRIQSALADRDSKLAVTIGKERQSIEKFHSSLFQTYTREMEGSKHTQDLAFALLTLNEIMRIGEALQAISEAILSINIGQSVRFEKYFTLRSILSSVSDGKEVALTPLAETRSGSAISSVRMRGPSGDTISAVFKDGDKRKVKEERVGVKSWNSVYPGLAPEILSYEKNGKSAALLIEHLDGETFEDIVLGGSDAALAEAQTALHRTVRDIWRQTASPEPAAMQAMDQLSKRMKDVYRLHPWFARAAQNVNGCVVHCFDELIAQAASREERLSAPFSVYIHGDFNLDNVIYDPVSAKIRFIDLHRSRYMDYVQDVSVFMVSNYRLQVLDQSTRQRIAGVATEMHQMASKFARRRKDATYDYRLALGLARSFASSTRFVVDQNHARRMLLRARYILETALAVPEGREARFKLPIRELFND